jgi:hypothetical protein
VSINGTVTGDREVVQELRAIGPAVREELGKAMGRITLKLMREVVQNRLTGQVLKRRTGTLARSVTQSPRTFQTAEAVVGVVGLASVNDAKGRAPVKYGRAHEFGFSGSVPVKQHLRLTKQAFGKALRSPVWATVQPHTRQTNLPARSFLRTALADLEAQGVYRDELQSALAEAIRR